MICHLVRSLTTQRDKVEKEVSSVRCEICDIDLHVNSWEAHVNGSKHTKRLRQVEAAKIQSSLPVNPYPPHSYSHPVPLPTQSALFHQAPIQKDFLTEEKHQSFSNYLDPTIGDSKLEEDADRPSAEQEPRSLEPQYHSLSLAKRGEVERMHPYLDKAIKRNRMLKQQKGMLGKAENITIPFDYNAQSKGSEPQPQVLAK